MKHTLLAKTLFLVCWLLASLAAHAQLAIEITGAGANRIPVAIARFAGENALPAAVSDVVRSDLLRSGLFNLIETGPQAIGEDSLPDLTNFRIRGADAMLVGSVTELEGKRFEVRFRLFDTQRQTELGALALRMSATQHRATGHRIADFVYEKLTGLPGVFSTRIAYVVKTGKRYRLQIADADGENPQTALASLEPIISPAWSPDGSKLAYVSFEAKKPVVYIHSLATGLRSVVANFKGSNSAPAWSPDGERLAVVLTKDGQSQLYTVNADGSGVRRIASSSGIDTEPSWSSDGQWIYFTSDRGGSPQLYRVAPDASNLQRISFSGSYNVTPRPSPDNRSLAFVTRSDGRFQIAVMDLASRQVTILTDTERDESPSFAPNGRMILYATEIGGRGVLAAVSSDGRVKQKLTVQEADVREPAWGPLSR
ncbi:MAG: Tol-Pal system protein TolB [Rhodocyclaceae bacterium]|nr:Tol-Pal system protein TolB [Rhodocyclaceae bacterium]